MHAWAYPGVDCCLGFLAAWSFKGGLRSATKYSIASRAVRFLLFHAWMTLSAVIAVCRNIWQSASELSLRGLAYNVWLTRGISWHDDYYPLQDPFFYSVAMAMLFGTWALVQKGGDRLMRRLGRCRPRRCVGKRCFRAVAEGNRTGMGEWSMVD